MFVEELNLIGFRNYLEARIRFAKPKTIIIGKNAQGKTNLLEVFQILSGLRSQRATKDSELINFSLDTAIVHATVIAQSTTSKISILIRPSGRRSIKVNDVNKSNKELNALISSVSFMITDLELVSGSPSNRRDWINGLATQLNYNYELILKEFEKILSQRNGYITKLVEAGLFPARLNPSQRSELDLWNDLYIEAANKVTQARIELIEQLSPIASSYYASISANPDEQLKLNYAGTLITKADLEACLAKDFARMHTTIGPQRHDIELTLGAQLASHYASQGQRRTIVLALKLSELELLRANKNSQPILLLDDVLAELDEDRQAALLAAISPETQVIITTTSLGKHLEQWSQDAELIEIEQGVVKQHAQV